MSTVPTSSPHSPNDSTQADKSDLEGQMRDRRRIIESLRQSGQNPFANDARPTHQIYALPASRQEEVASLPLENELAADAPRYAVSVVVEHGGGGSLAAAPIARDVMTFLFDPVKAMATLTELEKSWGGTPAQRMAAKYSSYVTQVGTSAPKVGDDAAVSASMSAVDTPEAPPKPQPCPRARQPRSAAPRRSWRATGRRTRRCDSTYPGTGGVAAPLTAGPRPRGPAARRRSMW